MNSDQEIKVEVAIEFANFTKTLITEVAESVY
jgi:hypothetical protein